MNKSTNQQAIGGVIAFALAILALIFWFMSDQPEITTFEECLEAGNQIQEIYPRRCVTPEGEVFTEEVDLEIPPSYSGPDTGEFQGEGQPAIPPEPPRE
jgi:hypothetical protein